MTANSPAGAVAVLAFVAATAALDDGTTARTVTYRTVGPLAIPANVFRPAGPGPHPVVLWIHGGALVFGDRGMLPQEQRERYLRAGLAVVSIDYRLAPETKLAGILEDLDAAHAWLRREGPSLGLDPARLAVVGHSAGGYLALVAGARFRPRPQAVVSFYGYGDVAGPWYSRPDPGYLREAAVSPEEAERSVGREPLAQGDESRRFVFYRYARQRGLWPQLVAGHDPDREPRAFDPLCPVRNVTPDFPPTLLLHGDRDADVPYERSVAMARALQAAGVPHELVTLPGLGHVFDIEGPGLADPAVGRAFDRAVAFVARRVGAALPPVRAGHPRLLLDRARVAELRERLDTTHRFLWERYQQDLPRMVAVSKREAPLEDARYDGDLVPELAFAWLMTGRDDLLAVAKAQLLRLATDEEWSTNDDLAYLVPGHYILGMALGYDWLYEALTPAERATVAARLGREAEAQFGRITRERAWWRNQYFQNHSQSNTAALAFAAAALWGEDPRAPEWARTTARFFEQAEARGGAVHLPRDDARSRPAGVRRERGLGPQPAACTPRRRARSRRRRGLPRRRPAEDPLHHGRTADRRPLGPRAKDGHARRRGTMKTQATALAVLCPGAKVRAFLVEYQDRVRYATETGIMPGQDPEALGWVHGLATAGSGRP